MYELPDDLLFKDITPQDFYAHIVLSAAQQRGVLTRDHLARQVIVALEACRASAPGSLWAYTVLPDTVRLIVGPAGDDTLASFVENVKTLSAAQVIHCIQRTDDDALDAVLHYHPMWGGAIYRLWEIGYHKSMFWTPYQLSNTIYALRQIPVEMGLASVAETWPYTWVGGADEAGA